MDKTIYRKYANGEIIALFPQIAASMNGGLCASYTHIGQHSAATPQLVINHTRLATPNEYKELHAELEQIGYNPEPAKRFTRKDFEIRTAQFDECKEIL